LWQVLSFIHRSDTRIILLSCLSESNVKCACKLSTHCELANFFFQKDPKFSKFLKGESFENINEKLIRKKNSALQHIFDIFSRTNQDFSGNHLSEFQKILNLIMQFHTKTSKTCSIVHAKFQLSNFYPDGLRHILDHF
jgi:hypothetical protein